MTDATNFVIEMRKSDTSNPIQALDRMGDLATRQQDALTRISPPPDLEGYHQQRLASLESTQEGIRRAEDLLSSSGILSGPLNQKEFSGLLSQIDTLAGGNTGTEPIAVAELRKRTDDPLSSYLVQAYELGAAQSKGPSSSDCTTSSLVGSDSSKQALDDTIRQCLQPAVAGANDEEARWSQLSPPQEATSFQDRNIQLWEEFRKQEGDFLTSLGTDHETTPSTDFIAAWLNLQVEWDNLAITALSR